MFTLPLTSVPFLKRTTLFISGRNPNGWPQPLLSHQTNIAVHCKRWMGSFSRRWIIAPVDDVDRVNHIATWRSSSISWCIILCDRKRKTWSDGLLHGYLPTGEHLSMELRYFSRRGHWNFAKHLQNFYKFSNCYPDYPFNQNLHQ